MLSVFAGKIGGLFMLTQLTRGGQECVVMAGHDRSELFVTTKVVSGSWFFQKYVNGESTAYMYTNIYRDILKKKILYVYR